MKNIAKVLDQLVEKNAAATKTGDYVVSPTLVEAAQKEFRALLAAGIGVEIENVERVKVVKTKMRHNARKAKKPRTQWEAGMEELNADNK
jgi:hypothetical protein